MTIGAMICLAAIISIVNILTNDIKNPKPEPVLTDAEKQAKADADKFAGKVIYTAFAFMLIAVFIAVPALS